MSRFATSKITDASGRPFLIRQDATHDVATHSPRWAGLYAPDIGPNAANVPDLQTARARCRAIERSNPMIARGLRILCANVVGAGIKPQPIGPQRKEIQAAFGDWVDVADYDGRTDFYGCQNLALRHMILDGEGLTRFIDLEPGSTTFDGTPMNVPLQLQTLAPDLLLTTKNYRTEKGNFVRAGVEFDQRTRRVVAYELLKAHPTDSGFWNDPTLLGFERVPVEDIIHLFVADAAGQVRGWPLFSRAVLTSHTKGMAFDAALQRYAMAVMFAAFVKSQDGHDVLGDGTAPTSPPVWEPGTVARLREGEDIVFPTVPDVGTKFEDFQHWIHLELAAGTLTTFEQFTGDLSRVNYSSIRAGLIDLVMLIQQIQHLTMNPVFNRRVWNRWLPKAVLAGVVSIPNFTANRVVASRVKWIPPARPWVDPAKEVAADIAACRANFRSIPSVINEKFGEDGEQVLQEIADFADSMDKLKLVSDADARKTAGDAAQKGVVTPESPIRPPRAKRDRRPIRARREVG